MDIYDIIVSEKYKHFLNINIENAKERYKQILGMGEESKEHYKQKKEMIKIFFK